MKTLTKPYSILCDVGLIGSVAPSAAANLVLFGGEPLGDPGLLAQPRRMSLVTHAEPVVRGQS